MSVIDPVADMLTRVRNACLAGHRRVDMPVSKLKVAIATILRDNHYVQDFKVLDDGQHGLLRLYLKYHNDAPVIRELQRVSSPGLRRYVKAREIPRVKNGLGMAILSTPQGLMTDREARTARVGGEALAVGWETGIRSQEPGMSRIGRKPVALPKGVTAQIDGHHVTVKGPKGEISRALHDEMQLSLEDGRVVVQRPSDEARHKALHGLTRTLVANMVEGVTTGFAKSVVTPSTMLATSVRVRPWSALWRASSDGRFTTTVPSSSDSCISSCSAREISPFGPFTVTWCPSICAVTPLGSATGFLPIRDIPGS